MSLRTSKVNLNVELEHSRQKQHQAHMHLSTGNDDCWATYTKFSAIPLNSYSDISFWIQVVNNLIIIDVAMP